MSRRLFLIIGSVVLALMGVFLANTYLEQQKNVTKKVTREEIIRRQEMQATAVVAKVDIAKGAVIQEGQLESKVVPKDFLQPQAVSFPERIVGMTTIAPIFQGEQITLSKLLISRKGGASTLAMATPVGKRAISLPVDSVSSLQGMIRPGDYVDVNGMVPVPVQGADGQMAAQAAYIPLFQNVLVLAVGRDMGEPASNEARYAQAAAPVDASLITLALTSQEANLLTFVQEQGKIRLVLRSPADSRIEPVQAANWEMLFQYLFPQTAQVKQETAEGQAASVIVPERKRREIEIYRGLRKESIAILDAR